MWQRGRVLRGRSSDSVGSGLSVTGDTRVHASTYGGYTQLRVRMDEEIVIPVSFFITVLALARMWFNSRKRSVLPDRKLEAIDDRMGRMEQAIDAIAIEVERISEGQRFTTRLLSDRAGVALPAGDQNGR